MANDYLSINYTNVSFGTREQLGGRNLSDVNEIDYMNGLSKNELQKIDEATGNDGDITEADFLKVAGDTTATRQVWNDYLSFFNKKISSSDDDDIVIGSSSSRSKSSDQIKYGRNYRYLSLENAKNSSEANDIRSRAINSIKESGYSEEDTLKALNDVRQSYAEFLNNQYVKYIGKPDIETTLTNEWNENENALKEEFPNYKLGVINLESGTYKETNRTKLEITEIETPIKPTADDDTPTYGGNYRRLTGLENAKNSSEANDIRSRAINSIKESGYSEGDTLKALNDVRQSYAEFLNNQYVKYIGKPDIETTLTNEWNENENALKEEFPNYKLGVINLQSGTYVETNRTKLEITEIETPIKPTADDDTPIKPTADDDTPTYGGNYRRLTGLENAKNSSEANDIRSRAIDSIKKSGYSEEDTLKALNDVRQSYAEFLNNQYVKYIGKPDIETTLTNEWNENENALKEEFPNYKLGVINLESGTYVETNRTKLEITEIETPIKPTADDDTPTYGGNYRRLTGLENAKNSSEANDIRSRAINSIKKSEYSEEDTLKALNDVRQSYAEFLNNQYVKYIISKPDIETTLTNEWNENENALKEEFPNYKLGVINLQSGTYVETNRTKLDITEIETPINPTADDDTPTYGGNYRRLTGLENAKNSSEANDIRSRAINSIKKSGYSKEDTLKALNDVRQSYAEYLNNQYVKYIISKPEIETTLTNEWNENENALKEEFPNYKLGVINLQSGTYVETNRTKLE